MKDVLCVGSATVDHFLTIELPFSAIKPGDKVLAQDFVLHTGGGATNAAVALQKLGVQAALLTKLGQDHNASFVQKELQRYHLTNACRTRSRKNTDVAFIVSSAKEHNRIIYVHKGASEDLSLTDIPHHLTVPWIYLASVTGHAFPVALHLAKCAEKKKIKLLFNPSLYLAEQGQRKLSPILKSTTLLVLNKEEAQAVLQRKEKDAITFLHQLQQLGPQTVVITDGPKTLFALHAGEVYTLTPPHIPVIETTGAGDAFTAGLLAGIIKKFSFDDALRLGAASASSTLQKIGAKEGLLSLAGAQRFLKRHTIPVKIHVR
ncbi:carbohydrate kinase family protein [Candidatus Woesearchaeota archaeon]|nr:carbohydrate kinase family protein [Candidatus Woesearchaeota archaeon]